MNSVGNTDDLEIELFEIDDFDWDRPFKQATIQDDNQSAEQLTVTDSSEVHSDTDSVTSDSNGGVTQREYVATILCRESQRSYKATVDYTEFNLDDGFATLTVVTHNRSESGVGSDCIEMWLQLGGFEQVGLFDSSFIKMPISQAQVAQHTSITSMMFVREKVSYLMSDALVKLIDHTIESKRALLIDFVEKNLASDVTQKFQYTPRLNEDDKEGDSVPF